MLKISSLPKAFNLSAPKAFNLSVPEAFNLSAPSLSPSAKLVTFSLPSFEFQHTMLSTNLWKPLTPFFFLGFVWAQAIPAYRSFKQKVSKQPRAMGNQCAKKDDTQRPSPSEPDLETGTTQTTQTVVKPEGVIDLSKLVPGDPTWWTLHCTTPGCPSWVYVAKTASPDYQNCNQCGQPWTTSWKQRGGATQVWDPTW